MANLARGNPARWWKSRSCGGVSRAPRSLHISPLRKWIGISTFLFFVLLFGGFWYITNPTRISRLSAALFSRVLGGSVKVRTGRISLSGTLLLSGVEVSTADPEPVQGGDVPLFSAENVEVRIDWLSLLSGQLSATQLVADSPVFRPIENRATGHWNYERLHPSGLGGAVRGSPGSPHPMTLPVVILRNARVKWGEVANNRVDITAETRIDGDLTPDAAGTSGYRFQFVQMAADDSANVGAVLHGTLNTSTNTFIASTENVDMTEALKTGLPRIAREWCDEHHLEGRLSHLNISFNPREGLTASVAFENVAMMFMVQPEQGIGMGEERPSYPVDVKNVRGEVDFLLNGPSIHIVNLTGEVLKYRFVADCDVQGTSFDSPFKLKLRFPDAYLGERYPPLFMAFLTGQDLLARVAPHGLMDISIDMVRKTPRGTLDFDGTVDCHDAQMRFALFPFPMDHINGQITFDRDTCTFHDVTAKGDLNDVLITGTTGTNWAHRAVDFTVSSKNTTFDDALAASMPEKYRAIWDLFALKAHGGFVCRVTRSNNVLDLPKVVVDVDVDDGSGYVRDMPFPFKNASGHLHFEADETRIEHLTATTGLDGTGRLSLDGIVHHPGGDVVHLQPELRAHADVPMDVEFFHGLPDFLTEKLKGTTLDGRLVFDGTLRRGATAEHGIQIAGDFDWAHGSLKTSLGGGIVLTGIAAHAAVSPTRIDVKSLDAAIDLAAADAAVKSPLTVNLAGAYQIETATGDFKVNTTTKGFIIPQTPAPFLPTPVADIWHTYAPSGTIDFDAHAAFLITNPALPAATSATKPALQLSDTLALDTYAIALRAHDAGIKNAAWPDPIRKINGVVNILSDKITMTDMSADAGNLSAIWSGQFTPTTGALALSGDAISEGWPAHWLSYLPPALLNNLDTKHEGTTLALHLDTLSRAATGKAWAFDGHLDAANFAISGPMPASADKIVFTGKGSFDPDATAAMTNPYGFTGSIAATNVTIATHLLDTLECTIDASAARHAIDISKVSGKVAGGMLQGDILVRTAFDPATQPASMPATAATQMAATQSVDWSSGGYEANLVLNDADLSRLMLPANATDEERKKVGTGHVFASLSLTETFGPHADRTGRGDLAVRDANIYNVPLSMGLMQVATLRLPVAKSFQEATMSYYLRNNEITFERILLESRGINIAGLGTVTLPEKRLDLSFATESPNELVIPVLSPLLAGFRNELMQLSVTGTVDDPKVTPVPLSGIASTLRTLLPTPRADAGH